MRVGSWVMRASGAPLGWERREERCDAGEALVEVAGCGVCHTDLGFWAGGVPTRHALPLTLGHEVSGTVVEAGAGAEGWIGRAVVVPAVIPCGACDACRAGRGAVCPKQVFPGNDVHGGFATHVRVPARGLCPVPDLEDPRTNPRGLALADLSVIADAVSTPYQAVVQSGLCEGDLAVFVGAGGVGGFGVQIAAALGAAVLAVDPSEARRALVSEHGAQATLDPRALDPRALKAAVRAFADARRIPTWRWRLFETSGTVQGQATAFGLLAPGAHLSLVGYTAEKVEVRLSNVMAFDATVRGTWGCLPELYPAVLDLVLSGRVALAPFVERRPLAQIQRTFEDLQAHRVHKRVVLVPER
jgi:6-hydroxycyclohex-1-ene-1-carbonyl-CoA dehydrogenase